MREYFSGLHKPLVVALASATALMAAAPSANAFELNFGDDSELSGNLDVTVGYATSFRTEDSDFDATGVGVQGNNELSEKRVPDSGDQISEVLSTSLELGLQWRNYGLELAGKYQYDTKIMNDDSVDPLSTTLVTEAILPTTAAPWSQAAEDYAGNNAELQDAFVYGAFDLGENALEVRLGKQVINWGEGLYFLDGISVQSSLNFNQFVTPGSELKDAYIGNTSAYAMLGVGESTTVEAYIHADWNRTELPPQGTFYGIDWFGRGGAEPVTGVGVGYRSADIEASDSGQWGISTRTAIGDVEYGLYYSKYHETMPFLESTGACLDSMFCTRQIWPEDLDMFGASFSTVWGDIAVAGEIAYRPDRPLMNAFAGVGAFGYDAGNTSIEKHDTINAAINAIWLGGATVMGIDTQVGIMQFGIDHISGDTSNLTPQSTVTRQKGDKAAFTDKHADSTSYGVAVEWIGTWQSALPNTDISLDLFLQHDISGYSHFWGNFAEGRTLASATVSASMGSGLEASIGYAYTDHEESDYEDQDTINLAVNYKF